AARRPRKRAPPSLSRRAVRATRAGARYARGEASSRTERAVLCLQGVLKMIRGVHTMFYSSEAEALREFLRDKLGFAATDVGGGWLIFDLPEADMGCHPADKDEAPS